MLSKETAQSLRIRTTCLKHKKEIFGEDLADYERFRTDEDREI
jgi:hypothetical protein